MTPHVMNLRSAFLSLAVMLCLCLGLANTAEAKDPNTPPNVLFIAIDDLRPELNCYGRSHIHSPNIDAFASGGVLFERAYCMVPTCGASRASLMTGLRPSRNRFVNYLTRADEDAAGIPALNSHFKSHGYHTISNGKVYHHVGDSQAGWSEPAWRATVNPYRLDVNKKLQGGVTKEGKKRRGPAFESSESHEVEHVDGMTAAKTIDDLQRLAKQDKPFFLAVGFVKPHLPFVAPKKYWDLYDPAKIQLPKNYNIPENAPRKSIHSFGELRTYHQIPSKGPVTEETARQLIQGYYACVSFTDAQVGRVLAELDRLKLSDNTIVVLWGDHGWNLGDHTLWCKHSCFESSMHSPLIVRAPGIKGGTVTRGLTEFIDVYPTLCDLAGLPKPGHLQGDSFVSLLHDPNKTWKTAAVGRFQSGDTIRTDQHRFTQYSAPSGKPVSRMLYDHTRDPLENTNVAEVANNNQRVESLTEELLSKKGKDEPAKANGR